MAGRGYIPYGGRPTQAPGMMRHGAFPPVHLVEAHPHELAENKLLAQSVEIERLLADNQKLAASHAVLRQDLAAAQQEIQRARAHTGSIQTESDIQIRILLEKIAKSEADIRAGETVRKDLQQAHMEARSLATSRQELVAQIQQASLELEKMRADVKKLPEMHVELESLRKEHQRLRNTFEYEKGVNMAKVEKMQLMEKDLVGMAREMERLRAEVLNAEKRANAPNSYGGPYMNSPLYPQPPPMHVSGGFVDGYGRPHVQMSGEGTMPYPVGGHGAAVPIANPSWAGPYDVSHIRR